MKKYDEYKPSGVEWVGDIPEHWEIARLKRLYRTKTGLTFTKSELVENGNPVISYGQIHSKINSGTRVTDDLIRFIPTSFSNQDALADQGDFIFADTSEDLDGCGNCVWINCSSAIYAGYHTILLKQIVPVRSAYLAYLFLTDAWRSQIRSRVYGVKVYSITQSILKLLTVIQPPLDVQKVIAEYLDEKCGVIDGLIEKEQKKIKLLDELKESIISKAVTQGLDPDAPLRPSGIEWIGDIPKHWKLIQLGTLCDFRNGYTPSKSKDDYWENGTIPWFRMEDIRESGRHLYQSIQSITPDAVKGGGLFKAGSFIVATTATIGEYAQIMVDSLANQQFTNLNIRNILSKVFLPDYFFYFLTEVSKYCNDVTNVSTFPSMDMKEFHRIKVTIPSVFEQKAIAEYLDRKCTEIDEIKAKSEAEIELLKELKSSLISNAVTGKIKVVE